MAEMVVALLAGAAAGSVSLLGFGIDSGIEVSAALILAWRLHQERRSGCMVAYDRTATRLIAGASWPWPPTYGSRRPRSGRSGPAEASLPGLLLAMASVI